MAATRTRRRRRRSCRSSVCLRLGLLCAFLFVLLMQSRRAEAAFAAARSYRGRTHHQRDSFFGSELAVTSSTPIGKAGEEVSASPAARETTTTTEADDDGSFLIHKGMSADMIRRSPALSGMTLCKGWSPAATEAFKVAVEAVVRSNPILTGTVYEVKRGMWPWQRGELRIRPGAFRPETHDFVTEVTAPPDLLDPSYFYDADETLSFALSRLAPLVDRVDFTYDQIRNRSPLFAAQIIELPHGYAAYTLKMSHAVGDGVTFFELVSQLASYMNGWDATPIDWNNPFKATHEFYPDNYSKRDVNYSYGFPFMWGCMKNIGTIPKRRCQYVLLSKDKIAQKKRGIRRAAALGSNSNCNNNNGDDIGSNSSSNGKGVSSNDIITASICEMNSSSDIFMFTENCRGIKKGVGRQTGGNFFWEIPFLKKVCTDPAQFRAIFAKGSYFGTNELPSRPFLDGKVGRITSLASITQKVTFPGTEIIVQFPFVSFISNLPLDVAVIFRVNDQYWGVLHNFWEVGASPLMDDIKA